MAPPLATTDGTNERAAKATIRSTDGLLAVPDDAYPKFSQREIHRYNNNAIIPEDHAITLLNHSRYQSAYIKYLS